MKTIYKWTLAVIGKQVLSLPKGTKFLDVQMQGGMPQLWGLCNPENEKEDRTILMFGTGNPVKDEGEYIGTFQMEEGALVFHVFEKANGE